jgi:DNA-binding HxlR family transcriptional regulator
VTDPTCVPFASDCHVRAAVELISHAWDSVVLTALRLGPTRRSELLHRISGVSDKALTESLRRLSSRGLVAKTAADSRRDVAVYELTELGASFAGGPLLQLAEWAAENQAGLSATS